MKKRSRFTKSCLSIALAVALSFGGAVTPGITASAAESEVATTITSMSYTDGPTFTASTLAEASFGFRMPTFNGDTATFGDVSGDLGVNVKVDGVWTDIDSVKSFVYNNNWGHWNDSGFSGYWFKLSETTYVQLYSKSNPSVTLEYNMIVNKTDMSAVTGLAPTAGTTINGSRSGTGFVAFPNAVSGSGTFATGADNFNVYVKLDGQPDSAYVNIENNAASGWIYDTNFGIEQYGYWFKVEESGTIQVKMALKENENIAVVYTITYSDTLRTDYTVYANGATTITANSETGAAGVVFPWLGGTADENLPTSKELDNFVIQFYSAWNDKWVDFTDVTESNWHYQGSGYVDYSSANQWGYFDDYVFGLWFQPITEDFKLRIGYPQDGQKGGEVGDNYIEYQFIGAPDAYRPVDVEIDDITVGGEGSSADALDGWDLYFSEEFNGNSLNMDYLSYNTGYFIDPSEPGTKGWGNNEAEYYTDEADNIFVSDGSLHLVAKKDPKTFTCTDAAQTQVTADYSSGKIISKDKVSFTYGRIDFRAKVPSGNGVWPALWMLPNDDTYGTWAASGEIDVMEARGRVDSASLGTIHFGGQWPNNKNLGGSYVFPEGTSYDDGYHVYSLIWEEDNMTFYVDGEFFYYIPKERWYSDASDSDTAPFDQPFYIIMNVAIGGNFDGGLLPDDDFTSAEMLVDYVRVYKEEGTYEQPDVRPIEGLSLNKTAVDLEVGQTAELLKTYVPENTTQRNVNWTSSNESVATVSAGQVIAVGEGSAVITATSSVNSAISATCVVNVKAAEVTTPEPDEDEVDPGEGGVDPGEGEVTPEPEIEWNPDYTIERIKLVDGNVVTYVTDADALISYYRVYDSLEAASNAKLGDLPGVLMSKNNGVLEYNYGEAPYGKYVVYAFNQAGWDTPRVVYVNNLPDRNVTPGETEEPGTGSGETEEPGTGSGETEEPEIGSGETEEPGTGSGSTEVSGEYGARLNDNGTVTFYVKAQDTAFAPMLYWGANKVDPQLWQLAGVGLTKDTSLGENYFGYTTTETFADTDSVSYMFGYTPIDGMGRVDSPITTVNVSSLKAEAEEPSVETPEGEYGFRRNADGSITYYVHAEETSFAPMVFSGVNVVDATLSKLGGAMMTKAGTEYYTYTTPYTVSKGSTVSYLFSFTPVDGAGRMDTAVITAGVN